MVVSNIIPIFTETLKQIEMKPILYILLIVTVVTICYYTGKYFLISNGLDVFSVGLYPLVVFLGALLWVLFGAIIIVAIDGYEKFKAFFKTKYND